MLTALLFALGATANLPGAAGACNAADLAKRDQVVGDLESCFASHQDADAHGIYECVVAKGFTSSCSVCVTDFGFCMAQKCKSMCTKGAESAECKQCVETHGKDCKDTFHKCSGFSKPDHAPLAPGECANDQDMKLELSLEKDVPACMKQTQTAEGIAACIAKDGFTAGCSKCVGVYGKCVLDNCLKECEKGPESDACKKCYETKCLPAFMTCSGYPVPKLGYSKSYSHTSSFSKTSTESYSSTYTSDGKNSKKTTKTSNEEVITKKSETTTTEVNGPGEAPGFGQCTTASDKKLWEQRLYRDIPACMKKTYFTEGTKAINSAEGPEIFRSGVVQCIEKDGFSPGCSQCVGDYAQAIEMHCSQQCNASGWDDACDKCIAEKAWPDFLKCSGLKPYAFENKCKSPQDQHQLPKKLFKFCMAVAKSASDLAACFEKTDGYTAGCADCFGYYAEATKESCGDACNNGYVDKCLKCLKGECEGFNKCTGYKLDCDKPPAQPVDQCTSAQDMKLGMQLIKDIPECMKKTQTITGISQCMKKDGFTGGCAFCVGEYGVSILRECPTECSKGYPGANDVCKKCIETKALPGFLKCSGYKIPKDEGKCTSPQDEKLWIQRLSRDMPACMKTAQTASGIAQCISKDGFSAGCSNCVGNYGMNILMKCGKMCKNGLDDVCQECIEAKALPGFLQCSGYKPGKCMSFNDRKFWELRLFKDIPECMQKTQTLEGIAACIKKDGFSAGCSECVGEYGVSITKECPTECKNGFDLACKKCIDQKSLPAFLKCSGYEPGNQCEAPQDRGVRAKMWEDRLKKDMPACMEKTQSLEGIAGCIMKDGFTAQCSMCVGEYGYFIIKECGTECKNGYDAACGKCIDAKGVGESFLQCSGYKLGKCASPDDQKLWEQRLYKDMPSCMKMTQTAEGIASCVAKDGFSAGCSECVGDYGVAIIKDCPTECKNGYDYKCKNCIEKNALPEFLKCSGYEPYPLENQCTSPADKKNWVVRLEKDMEGCLQKSQSLGGIAACIKTDGFSTGCSYCVAEYGFSVVKECSIECKDGFLNAKCGQCVEKKALPEFLKCSGYKPGKCTHDPADMKLWEQRLYKDMPACMKETQTAEDIAACIAKDGFSAGCSECVGDYGVSIIKNCGTECKNGLDDACDKCIEAKALPSFLRCSGYEPKEMKNMCTSAEDQKNWDDRLKTDMKSCMEKSQTLEGITKCIKSDGFSTGCSYCIGEYGYSIEKECPTQCAKGFESECQKCIIDKALPEFMKCSGYWDPKPKVNECTSASDMKLWEQRLYKDMPACMKNAKDALGITVCIAADGFSAGCAECVGEYGVSIMKNCPTECKNGLDDACFECIGKKSLPAFLKCSGYPEPKPFENQCLSEADTKNAEARLKKDMPECMKKTQTIEGIADCIKADGFSTGCSYCVGEYGFSMLKECPTECSKGYPGAGDVCKKCIEAKALPEFLKCSGYDTLKPKGQCTGAADMKNWEDRLIKDMPTCMENTKSTPDLIACFEKDGFSAGCSQCVGDYAMSIAKNCPTECHNGWDATCKACVEGKSLPAFLSCSGYKPKDLMPKKAGKCTSPEDSKLWESRLEKDMPLCMKQTQTAEGIAACIAKDGFSTGCSQCVGNYGMNIIMKCGTECKNGYRSAAALGGRDDATCKTCIADKCVPDFLACSGYGPKDLRPKQDQLVAPMARTE